MDQSERFGQLREVLLEPASIITWEDTLELLQGEWDDTDLQNAAIDYATSHLASWEDRLREASFRHWWPTFPAGSPSPFWQLARTCHFPPKPLGNLFATLIQSPHFQHITRLGLSYLQLSTSDLQTFLQTPLTKQLTTLHLNHNQLESDELSLFQETAFPKLTELSLSHNPIDATGVWYLQRASWFSQIRLMRLDHTNLKEVNESALQKIDLSSLEELHISHTGIGDHHLKALLDNPTFTACHTLSLQHNNLTTASAKILQDSPKSRQFKKLLLDGNDRDVRERLAASRETTFSTDTFVDILAF
jgi:hypothetical protein